MVKNKKTLISWLLVVIWMGVIFSFSQSNSYKSSSESRKIVIKIVDVVEKNKTPKEKELIVDKVHIPFRKFAHGFEFAILSILLIIALKNSKINKIYLLSFLISFLYAMTDEYHQTLINGRSGEIRDILIDTSGALIGIIIYLLCKLIKKQLKKT